MCNKKNSVLFTNTECLILSPSFKLIDESQVVLRAPRQNDVYNLDLKNIVPSGGITCLYANATTDESKLWHRRLGHVNFKNINKLVKGYLVRGLPSKVFVNDHTCVPCKKGKQHKASYLVGCDHGTEFKNHAMNEFCAKKGIKREFSVARIPQQNEVVNIACYVLNRVLVTKPQNKTPYELLIGKPPSICFMRSFECPLTILNTLDPLGKFDEKSDKGYLLGHSTTSKAFRVYNKRTKRVEENIHIDFLEDQPNVAGSGPDWMFDLLEDQPNVAGSGPDWMPRILVEDVVQAAQEKPSENSPKDSDVQDSEDVAEIEEQHTLTEAEQVSKDDLERMIAQEIAAKAIDDATRQAFEEEKKRATQATSINKLNTGRPSVSTSNSPLVSTANTLYASAASTPLLEDDSNVFPNDGIFIGAYDDEDM
ncbi:ribonuclease H-like domain-containing protein, partial [Tanacetum coccineum]